MGRIECCGPEQKIRIELSRAGPDQGEQDFINGRAGFEFEDSEVHVLSPGWIVEEVAIDIEEDEEAGVQIYR